MSTLAMCSDITGCDLSGTAYWSHWLTPICTCCDRESFVWIRFEAITAGAREILLGDANAVLVGEQNLCRKRPTWFEVGAKASRLAVHRTEDSLWSCLTDTYTDMPMAITAENLATQYNISRADCDEYALRSQKTWANAQENGFFDDEICPIEIKTRKGVTSFDTDEDPDLEAT